MQGEREGQGVDAVPPGAQAGRVHSALMSPAHNTLLSSLIGHRSSVLAAAVAQVFLTAPGGVWGDSRCGVVCLVKDRAARSYFLRLYCLQKAMLLWEQELYQPFRYSAPRPFFHTFPGDDCQVGLNFADEGEALVLRVAVERRISHVLRHSVGHNSPASRLGSTVCPPMVRAHSVGSSGGRMVRRRLRLNKNDIGSPTNFQHLSHIAWHAETGFDVDVDNLDPALVELFVKAGIRKTDLQDQRTSQAIFHIIQSQGGLEAVRKEVHSTGAPPQTLQKSSCGPPSPAALKRPGRPLLRSYSAQALPLPQQPCHATLFPPLLDIPPPPSIPAPPPPSFRPPPPPPAPRAPPAAPGDPTARAPSAAPAPPAAPSAPLTPPATPPGLPSTPQPPPEATAAADPQFTGLGIRCLMDQIRHGVSLKTVSMMQARDLAPPPVEPLSIVAALRDVMQKRYSAMNPTEDLAESEEDSDGAEWC